MGFFDFLSSTAVSFTVAGNTGVSPFLSLFVVGIMERVDPGLLNMTGMTEKILSSWPSVVMLGLLTAVEFVGKCIPVVDQVLDSAMTFVVPIFSALGSLSTFGIFDQLGGGLGDDDYGDGDDGRRALSVASGAMTFFQVCLIVVGIGLALAIHLFKMLLRLIGEGWLTNILTVLETSWIVISMLIAIFIRQLAIFIAAIIICAAGYAIKRKYFDLKPDQQDGAIEAAGGEDYVRVEDPPVVAAGLAQK